MKGKRIVVIGGAGYIGSACVHALCERGDNVIVLDDLSTGQRDKIDERANFVEGDIRSREVLDDVFKDKPIDAVLHFAAKKSVEEGEINPGLYFEVNVGGTMNVLDAMERHRVPVLVFSSTAAVYNGEASLDRFSENSHIGPVNVYGTTKLIPELIMREYVRINKLNRYVALRYFNVAGDAGLGYRERNAKNVFPILAEALEENRPFFIFGTDYPTKDGTCVRDYIHISDLVNAHLSALDREVSGSYNLGSSKGYSVRELVAAFEKLRGKTLLVKEASRRPGDSPQLLADASNASRDLKWQPQCSLEEMVQSTLTVYQK